MKRSHIALLVLSLLQAPVLLAQEPRPALRWDVDYLERTFDVRMKSATAKLESGEYRLLLEFVRDNEDIVLLTSTASGKHTLPLRFLFYKADGVSVAEVANPPIEGEITGKAGTKFSVVVAAPKDRRDAFAVATKVSARPFGDAKEVAKNDMPVPVVSPKRAVLDADMNAMVKLKVTTKAELGEFIRAMDQHPDKDFCCKGSDAERRDQTWIVGKRGELANVVVMFEPPAGKQFAHSSSKGVVVLDQPHCAFVPHIVAVKPGQTLLIKNSAEVSHNIKIRGSENDMNTTLPPGRAQELTLVPERQPLTVSCQIHGWMQAKIYALNHPFFGVTNANGELTIPNLPSGVELTMVLQHDGLREPVRKTVKLKSGANEFEERLNP